MARTKTLILDKTGTLTIGRPQVARVIPVPPFTEPELLRLAAAVEHGSSHLLARTLVDAASARGIPLAEAHHAVILPGFTHMQVAQPVTFGHHLMAYFEMFSRDAERLGVRLVERKALFAKCRHFFLHFFGRVQ